MGVEAPLLETRGLAVKFGYNCIGLGQEGMGILRTINGKAWSGDTLANVRDGGYRDHGKGDMGGAGGVTLLVHCNHLNYQIGHFGGVVNALPC